MSAVYKLRLNDSDVLAAAQGASAKVEKVQFGPHGEILVHTTSALTSQELIDVKAAVEGVARDFKEKTD